MSIPGLGQIPTQVSPSPLWLYDSRKAWLTDVIFPQPTASSSRTITLNQGNEYRFQAPHGTSTNLSLRLLSGTAEKDGTELAPGVAYNFSGTRSKILTWQRCDLQVEGQTDEERVATTFAGGASSVNVSATAALNLHVHLNELRAAASRSGSEGPRVLVAGPANTGKTTLTRTLAAYATRQGYQPLIVNTDPEDGILTLPGTLSAAVFGTIMDIESVGEGWGGTPMSGPSSVPVKLPLVQYFGHRAPTEEPEFYKQATSKLAAAVSGRLSGDEEVRRSGIMVDSMGVPENGEEGIALLAHIVEEFSSELPEVPSFTIEHLVVTMINKYLQSTSS